MKKLFLAVLIVSSLTAQTVVPVPRPNPLGYQPSPSASTVSVKWFHYAVYLESEIARLKSASSEITTVIQRLDKIDANTAALAGNFHAVRTNAEKAAVNSTALLERPRVPVDLTPVTAGVNQITAQLAALDTRLQSVVPPSKITITIPGDVREGSNVTLIATADGSPTPTYQWRKNGIVIPGATNASFTLTAVTTADSATYTVTATNASGSITTSDKLVVIPAGPSAARKK